MFQAQRTPAGTNSEAAPIRVLVVDDSAFMRFTITRRLNEAPGLVVVGAARDGQEALEMIPGLNPHVVTLDVEMPRLNGLSTLREIMRRFPRPVIMLSSLTSEGANETIQALTYGAVDFIAKPGTRANIDAVMDEVAEKIKRAAGARVFPGAVLRQPAPAAEPARKEKRTRPLSSRDRVVIIGASTGGPRALSTVVPKLSAEWNAGFVIVQHMPAGFTRSLAERLDSLSSLVVREACPGDRLEAGLALLAPGGFHLTFNESGQAVLNQNPPVHGVRPAIDVTMSSLVQRFGAAMIGVVLTGMGSDGARGSQLIRSAGGWVIAEDESSCVVWGMPRSVTELGAANAIAPLPEIAAEVKKALRATG